MRVFVANHEVMAGFSFDSYTEIDRAQGVACSRLLTFSCFGNAPAKPEHSGLGVRRCRHPHGLGGGAGSLAVHAFFPKRFLSVVDQVVLLSPRFVRDAFSGILRVRVLSAEGARRDFLWHQKSSPIRRLRNESVF